MELNAFVPGNIFIQGFSIKSRKYVHSRKLYFEESVFIEEL